MSSARNRRPARADIRAALLSSAEAVFAEHGFEAASVESIAERAGYSTGAIYSNFSGKEELFLALLDERMTTRTQDIRRATAQAPDVDSTLDRGSREFMELLQQDRDWFLLLFEFWTYAARRPDFGRRFAEHHREIHRALADLVESNAQRLGLELGMSAAEAAMILKALSNGLALESLIDRDAVPPDLLARALALMAAGTRDSSSG